jgi:hypothetical protein
LNTTPSTSTTAGTILPTTGTWGETRAWTTTVPTAAAGQAVFQSNGLYNPVSNTTVWSVPYLSNLKVGNLSAITTNTGTLNVSGTISSANGNFTVDASGNATMKAITIKDSSGNTILSSGTSLNPAYAAAGTLNSAISLSSNGTLSGAGGGAVTITGLGYSGALNATANATTQGILLSRPTGSNGDFYYATDNSTLYQKIAGAWVASSTVGAPSGTLVSGVAADTVATAATNFNASNDRNGAAITAPTILSDGSAVDHTLRTDGSADISFEWAWAGTEGDIDGFQIYVYQSASSSAYTFGTSVAAETVYTVPANKRAFILFGVAANLYTTFGVLAYRSVDKDINSTGVIKSTLVKPSMAAENPYRPSANVAFAGNVTGTVNGVAASSVNVWSSISGTGKPEDNATRGATLGWDVAGQITASNINGLISSGAIGSTYISDLAASKITAGTLAAGVVYAGTISAGQVSAGTLEGVTFEAGTGHTPSGRAVEIQAGGLVWIDNIQAGNVDADNSDYPSVPAVRAWSEGGTPSIRGYAYSQTDALKCTNGTYGAEGVVGASNGYDFYATGSGPNYGPFTGSHDGLLLKDSSEPEIGDIMVDVEVVRRSNVSNTIAAIGVSSVPCQKNVIGVFVRAIDLVSINPPAALIDNSTFLLLEGPQLEGRPCDDFDEIASKYRRGIINSLGEGQVNVCGENGDIEAGDYITTSSTPGKGMRQGDDTLRNYTVAKARESVTFSSPDEVKMIACTYHCG